MRGGQGGVCTEKQIRVCERRLCLLLQCDPERPEPRWGRAEGAGPAVPAEGAAAEAAPVPGPQRLPGLVWCGGARPCLGTLLCTDREHAHPLPLPPAARAWVWKLLCWIVLYLCVCSGKWDFFFFKRPSVVFTHAIEKLFQCLEAGRM